MLCKHACMYTCYIAIAMSGTQVTIISFIRFTSLLPSSMLVCILVCLYYVRNTMSLYHSACFIIHVVHTKG